MLRLSAKGFFAAVIFSALSVIFIFSGTARASAPRDYSADMINRHGAQITQSKINVSGDKVRLESEGNIMIFRPDKNIFWIVMPSEKMYMEQPIDQSMLPQVSGELPGEVERVSLGRENVGGRSAEKFKVTYRQGVSVVNSYQWIGDLGLPLKMEAEDGSWGVEYRNISAASQPASLFEPPQGYQKMSLPFGGGF